MLEVLKAHKGPVLLSGYDSELYNDLLQGWKRERISTRAQTAEKRTEVLWMNFDYLKQESLWEVE